MKVKLFSMVKCKAYLERVKDSVHIVQYNEDGTICFDGYQTQLHGKAIAYKFDADKGEEVEIADLSEYCGQSVEKTYRVRKEQEFVGCVVGYTRVNTKALIGTDWNDSPFTAEFGFCFKEITECPKVAVVYFKNNCKRYVLPEDITGVVWETV